MKTRLLGRSGDEILPAGGLGAILARPGVGKTALVEGLAVVSAQLGVLDLDVAHGGVR